MISVAGMREAEKKAIEAGMDEPLMMENAGANAARIVDEEKGLDGKSVMVFCGTGNNAGDGLVFARHALGFGASVIVYFVKGRESLKPLALKNYEMLKKQKPWMRGKDVRFTGKITGEAEADILVDAMLGIGVSGNVREEYAKAIRQFNSMRGFKVSLDCPSGIDADTGKVLGTAAKPDMTITFHDVKPGLSEANSGRIFVAGIGL